MIVGIEILFLWWILFIGSLDCFIWKLKLAKFLCRKHYPCWQLLCFTLLIRRLLLQIRYAHLRQGVNRSVNRPNINMLIIWMTGSWCGVFIKKVKFLLDYFILGQTEKIVRKELPLDIYHNAQNAWVEDGVIDPFLWCVKSVKRVLGWGLQVPYFETVLGPAAEKKVV